MPRSNEQKDLLVSEARRVFDKRVSHLQPISRSCLILAGIVCDLLNSSGEPALLQAGSLSWWRIRPEEDDGVIGTHFSYEWQGYADFVLKRGSLVLPEMHCWAGLPLTGELVDVTTRYLPIQCKETAGLDWTAPPPQDYVWGPPPPEACYRADRTACLFAVAALSRFLKDYGLPPLRVVGC